MKNIFILLLLTSALIGCDGAIESEYKEEIVVQGFIYPNEPVEVSLHYTIPFGTAYNDTASAVIGADVRVRVDGVEHQLIATSRKGRYTLPASALVVEGGKEYELIIKKDQHNLYARTRVPMPILFTGLNDSLPKDRILPLDTNDASKFVYGVTAGPRAESWRLYMLQVTALDTTLGKIPTSIAGPPVDTSAYVRYSFFQTAPNFRIYSRLFGWFGPNRMTVLSLDSNWVEYKRAVGYGDQSFVPYQPSLNHIIGGLGVWASAARDTTTVYVKPK